LQLSSFFVSLIILNYTFSGNFMAECCVQEPIQFGGDMKIFPFAQITVSN